MDYMIVIVIVKFLITFFAEFVYSPELSLKNIQG